MHAHIHSAQCFCNSLELLLLETSFYLQAEDKTFISWKWALNTPKEFSPTDLQIKWWVMRLKYHAVCLLLFFCNHMQTFLSHGPKIFAFVAESWWDFNCWLWRLLYLVSLMNRSSLMCVYWGAVAENPASKLGCRPKHMFYCVMKLKILCLMLLLNCSYQLNRTKPIFK